MRRQIKLSFSPLTARCSQLPVTVVWQCDTRCRHLDPVREVVLHLPHRGHHLQGNLLSPPDSFPDQLLLPSQSTILLLMLTGLVAVLTGVLGYTAILTSSKPLLALVSHQSSLVSPLISSSPLSVHHPHRHRLRLRGLLGSHLLRPAGQAEGGPRKVH